MKLKEIIDKLDIEEIDKTNLKLEVEILEKKNENTSKDMNTHKEELVTLKEKMIEIEKTNTDLVDNNATLRNVLKNNGTIKAKDEEKKIEFEKDALYGED